MTFSKITAETLAQSVVTERPKLTNAQINKAKARKWDELLRVIQADHVRADTIGLGNGTRLNVQKAEDGTITIRIN